MSGKISPLFFFLILLGVAPECRPLQSGFRANRDGRQESPAPSAAAASMNAMAQDQIDSAAPSRVISPRIGLCTDLLYMSPSQRSEMIGKLAPLGPRVIRETFRWHLIEPKKGRFEWKGTDALVENLEGSNLEILAILMAAPEWAGGSDMKTGSHPPDSPDDYARFVDAVVKRYKGRIKYYELWNEPNIARFWGGKRAEPKDFIALLRAGYRAGKKADPQAVFVMGGVTKLSQDQAFMKDVIRMGGLDACDAVGVHLYPENLDRFRSIMTHLVSSLQKAGCSKPVWVTETGWPSRELDLKKYMTILAERGISKEKARKSVSLRRAIGHVYDFTPEEQRMAQDDGARQRELKELGLTEESLDSIIRDSALDKVKKQAETVWKLGQFLEGQNRVARIFWYRLDDRHDTPVKEANFGLIGVGGDLKTSFRVLEGRIQPGAGKSGR